jgi:spermidine synthase
MQSPGTEVLGRAAQARAESSRAAHRDTLRRREGAPEAGRVSDAVAAATVQAAAGAWARRAAIHALVGFGGVAALSWEVLWQIRASLALGVSALATAITLAAAMGGMATGSFLAGRWLRGRPLAWPLRVYGALELAIGAAGLATPTGFRLLERIDVLLYAQSPALAPFGHALGVALLIGPAAIAMGASIPVFARVGAAHGVSLAGLYGANTLGAAAGVLLNAFALVPWLGLQESGLAVAAANASVFAAARALERRPAAAPPPAPEPPPRLPPARATAVVFATGFATFALEVAWFRGLRGAFQSSTDSFAIMLFAVLLALGAGARIAPALRRHGVEPSPLLGAAAVAILLATPFVERMDLLVSGTTGYAERIARRAAMALATLGVPMLLLGAVLPWLLEEYQKRGGAGWLYAQNTLGSVAGSLLATWCLLPTLGFARTAWAVGAGVALLAAGVRARGRALVLAAGAAALALAVRATEDLGRRRVLGTSTWTDLEVVAFEEGVEATAAVVEGHVTEARGTARALVIDGFVATAEDMPSVSYMAWMGRLPMLLHPDPRRALVLCFGTGQTAHAVRQEGPERLDVVELNPAVLRMAPHFRSNGGVLDDARVRTIVMDGRAWLRRNPERYDVVTLEPMPPHFAGTNALYSREFYEIVASRLAPGGIVAQWVPFHLLPPFHAASIARTFQAVFPDALLWRGLGSSILVGRRAAAGDALGREWPGLARPAPGRPQGVERAGERALLDAEQLARWAARGEIVSDDNQLLAYGSIHRELWTLGNELPRANRAAIREAQRGEVPGLRARPRGAAEALTTPPARRAPPPGWEGSGRTRSPPARSGRAVRRATRASAPSPSGRSRSASRARGSSSSARDRSGSSRSGCSRAAPARSASP